MWQGVDDVLTYLDRDGKAEIASYKVRRIRITGHTAVVIEGTDNGAALRSGRWRLRKIDRHWLIAPNDEELALAHAAMIDLVAVFGIVAAISAGYVGCVWVVVRQLSDRIDDLRDDLGTRVDGVSASLGADLRELRSEVIALGRTVAEHHGRLGG